MTNTDEVLTVAKAARLLSITTARAYQLIHNGKLPAYRDKDNAWMITKADVEARKAVVAAYLAKQMTP